MPIDKEVLGSIKKQTASAYDMIASKYGEYHNVRFNNFLQREMGMFVQAVQAVGSRVVDLGSGPGDESLYIKAYGLDPVCVDIAPRMVRECRRKGLETYLMDFSTLGFPEGTFAGAWMALSLLHVPKLEAFSVLQEVDRVLVDQGIFYVSLFEGEGEGLREDFGRYGIRRYFALYRQDEIQHVLHSRFDVVRSSRLEISPRPTISFLCRKKN